MKWGMNVYLEKELVRIAKRENNSRRNYLVVNPLQGKHIPVRPGEALKLFSSLADILSGHYGDEKLLLVGFAETATAIGAHIAVCMGADYIQTTREDIPGAEYLFFSEEHSHASEQRLVKNDMDRAAESADRVLFIEDEITTGNTILNIVSILDKRYPGKLNYAAASLLNGMDQECRGRYDEKGINLHYLVKTDHGDYSRRAEKFSGDGIYHLPDFERKPDVPEITVRGALNARRLLSADVYAAGCESLWKQIQRSIDLTSAEKILVTGTEEFMYPALYVAEKLERMGRDVRCHSTTRSPITVSTEQEYPLHERYELRSLYDAGRKTFLYDIDAYDKVLVVTDAPAAEEVGLRTLCNALGTKNSDITVIRWC